MNNTELATPLEGELVEFTAEDAAEIFENLITFYPDLKQVVPLARVIANIGLYKPVRTFNDFESRTDLAKSVTTLGPYNFLNNRDIIVRTCDLSFDYDFVVFLFMLHMVITLKSFKFKFSTASFINFKEKCTKNSCKAEADKLEKSLERHYTVDLQYRQANMSVASRMLSSFSRVTPLDFEVELVPNFFKIYAMDGGHVIPVVIEELWSSPSLEDKIKLFLKGSQFKQGVRAEFEGFCRMLGYALMGDKLERKAKSKLKDALENLKRSGVFKTYSFEEGYNVEGKKIIKAILFTYGETQKTLSSPKSQTKEAPVAPVVENKKADLQTQCAANNFALFDETPEDFFKNL